MMNPLLGWAGLFGISSARKRGLEPRSGRSEVVTSKKVRERERNKDHTGPLLLDHHIAHSRRASDRTEHSNTASPRLFITMTEYDGDIIAPTAEKPTDRAWWKSATVYQGESRRSSLMK
jgi:hypothetical protein